MFSFFRYLFIYFFITQRFFLGLFNLNSLPLLMSRCRSNWLFLRITLVNHSLVYDCMLYSHMLYRNNFHSKLCAIDPMTILIMLLCLFKLFCSEGIIGTEIGEWCFHGIFTMKMVLMKIELHQLGCHKIRSYAFNRKRSEYM